MCQAFEGEHKFFVWMEGRKRLRELSKKAELDVCHGYYENPNDGYIGAYYEPWSEMFEEYDRQWAVTAIEIAGL